MHKKQIELLELLLKSTHADSVVWRSESVGLHYAELAGIHCELRFKHPLLANNDGSDPDAVEITIGITAWTCYAGTQGYDLVGQILSAAYPKISEHNMRVTARLEETIERIRSSMS